MIRQTIISHMDLDTKRTLGIPPKKIKEEDCWKLYYTLKSHDGLIYDTQTKTLYNFFTYPSVWSIHRPVELSMQLPEQADCSNWCMSLFNLERESFTTEIFYEDGRYLFLPDVSEPWVTELKVLLK